LAQELRQSPLEPSFLGGETRGRAYSVTVDDAQKWATKPDPFIPSSRSLGRKLAHDGVDVDACAVQMWKVGIFRVKDQRKIRAGKKDRIHRLAINERVGEAPQVFVVILRRVLVFHNPDIRIGYPIDLCGTWAHDLHILESPEQLRLHGNACPENRDTLKLAPLNFGDDHIEETYKRKRRHLRQFLRANLRRERRHGPDLRSSICQLTEQTGQIGCEQ